MSMEQRRVSAVTPSMEAERLTQAVQTILQIDDEELRRRKVVTLICQLSFYPNELLAGMERVYTRVEQRGGIWVEALGKEVPLSREKEFIEIARGAAEQDVTLPFRV